MDIVLIWLFPAVCPELSTEDEEEGDDEDGSSDEFTDSIEEDDDKVTARSLASFQVRYLCLHVAVKPLNVLALCDHRLMSCFSH